MHFILIAGGIFCLCGLYLSSSTYFRLKLARYYIKTQNNDKLITIYKKIIRKEKFNTKRQASNVSQISNVYCNLYRLLLTKGELAESAHVLKQLHEINPSFQVSFMQHFENAKDYERFGLYLARVGLNNNAINQFQRFIALESDDPLARYYLALLYQKQGMQQDAEEQFNKIIRLATQDNSHPEDYLPDYLGDCYYNLALGFEKDGSINSAEEYYKKAIEISGNRLIDAYYRLEALYRKENKLTEAEAVRLEFSKLVPEYEVNYKLNNARVLLGYSLSRREFELFDRGIIIFFWELEGQDAQLSFEKRDLYKTYRIGDRLYEIKEVENLAPDFGFETDFLGKGFPYDWGTDRYGTSVEYHEIISKKVKNGVDGQCLLLRANPQMIGTNCTTVPIKIDGGSYYLQAGWLKSLDAKAYLGREYGPEYAYSYGASSIVCPDWKYFPQVIISPPKAQYVKLRASLVYSKIGNIYFDDILFIKLDWPN